MFDSPYTLVLACQRPVQLKRGSWPPAALPLPSYCYVHIVVIGPGWAVVLSPLVLLSQSCQSVKIYLEAPGHQGKLQTLLGNLLKDCLGSPCAAPP